MTSTPRDYAMAIIAANLHRRAAHEAYFALALGDPRHDEMSDAMYEADETFEVAVGDGWALGGQHAMVEALAQLAGTAFTMLALKREMDPVEYFQSVALKFAANPEEEPPGGWPPLG